MQIVLEKCEVANGFRQLRFALKMRDSTRN